ncbi:hypothetical protein QQF64_036141 [Cirrhinus molitorella]|uniref:Integrase zinc-binding domain-containing protein n=1 Tax=Cirrhinus molitorella TaxID=172907 RepID=A0ABR3NIK2_9TELE
MKQALMISSENMGAKWLQSDTWIQMYQLKLSQLASTTQHGRKQSEQLQQTISPLLQSLDATEASLLAFTQQSQPNVATSGPHPHVARAPLLQPPPRPGWMSDPEAVHRDSAILMAHPTWVPPCTRLLLLQRQPLSSQLLVGEFQKALKQNSTHMMSKETISEFAEEIRRLVVLAYPRVDIELREQITADAFLKGLRNQKVANEVMNGDPVMRDEAQLLVSSHEHNFKATFGRDFDQWGRTQHVSWADDNTDSDEELQALQSRRVQSQGYVTQNQLQTLIDKVDKLQLVVDRLPPPFSAVPPSYCETHQMQPSMPSQPELRMGIPDCPCKKEGGGGVRWCVDYHQLNDLTIKDAYALPKIEECLDVPVGAKTFSTLELQSGYWQIEIKLDHRNKTAFGMDFMSTQGCNSGYAMSPAHSRWPWSWFYKVSLCWTLSVQPGHWSEQSQLQWGKRRSSLLQAVSSHRPIRGLNDQKASLLGGLKNSASTTLSLSTGQAYTTPMLMRCLEKLWMRNPVTATKQGKSWIVYYARAVTSVRNSTNNGPDLRKMSMMLFPWQRGHDAESSSLQLLAVLAPSGNARGDPLLLMECCWRNEVLQASHNPTQAGHAGEEKTLMRMRRHYHWYNMVRYAFLSRSAHSVAPARQPVQRGGQSFRTFKLVHLWTGFISMS